METIQVPHQPIAPLIAIPTDTFRFRSRVKPLPTKIVARGVKAQRFVDEPMAGPAHSR